MTYISVRDPALAIATGTMPGVSHINKFGRNADIDTGTTPESIWDGGGLYVAPTQARTHQIASDDAADVGTIKSSGTVTSGSDKTLEDTGATFIADGVVVGDIVLNDTTQDHSHVVSIDSETILTVRKMHHETVNSASDAYRIVNPSGTGAAVTHTKRGLLADMSENTEFIVLNGVTPVSTVSAYTRINRFHIHGVGSNGTNVGTITATADTDATVTAQINPNNGQTLMAFFTIPKGKSGYLTSRYATLTRPGIASSAMAQMVLYERLWGDSSIGDGALVVDRWGLSVEGGSDQRMYDPYKYISEYSDIWMRCESVSDNDSDISGGFDIILVDK